MTFNSRISIAVLRLFSVALMATLIVVSSDARICGLRAQGFTPNYDETKIPAFTLPDLLVDEKGEKVTSAEQWEKAREHWLALCRDHVYGSWNCPNYKIDTEIVEQGEFLGGKAMRVQWRVTISNEHGSQPIDLLVYLPANASKVSKVPLFLGLNFTGNHSATDDPAVRLPKSWLRNDPSGAVVNHRATEAGRGIQSKRWPIAEIIEKGFGVATAYYGDLAPDDPGHYMEGLPRLNPALVKDLGPFPLDAAYKETKQPTTGGAIAVWSWGLSRLLDVLEKDPRIAGDQVIVVGHSRLGKTALWAGATDKRFAMVVSNNSGCGGAALSRRAFGETVQRINSAFPHWFCDKYRLYNKAEDSCPVDQHTLLALIAPRPLYVTSASEDLWADPKGEFLSAKEAGVVYRLLGATPMPDVDFPGFEDLGDGKVVYGAAVGDAQQDNVPTFATVAYHIRKGPHDILSWDWQRLMQFAKQHLSK
jgi:hypothetical protein